MADHPRHIVFVTGIIRNPLGELLMIKSSYRPGWEPPGGQVEVGEDLVQAVIRETKEETGYDVTVTRLLNVLQNTGGLGSEPKIGFVLEGELAGGTAATSSESQAVGWFAPEQAMELITLDWMKERVEDALKTDDNVKLRVYITKPSYETTLKLGHEH